MNLFAIRLGARLVYGSSGIVPWSGMGVLFTSQMAMGFLGGFLGVVLLVSGLSLVPLVLIVFVIGHLVFTSYAQLREAHESTLKGFILALEARDLYTRGHTERVAYFCRLIGEQLAFTGTQLERMRWAAIIHDMGKIIMDALYKDFYVDVIQKIKDDGAIYFGPYTSVKSMKAALRTINQIFKEMLTEDVKSLIQVLADFI